MIRLMPGLVESREAIVIAGAFARIHLALDLAQPLAQGGFGTGSALGRSKPLERHACLVDLPHFIQPEFLDRSAAEFLDGDEALGFQPPQGFAHLAATYTGGSDNIGFDQALAGHESTVTDPFAHPVGNVTGGGKGRGCGLADGLAQPGSRLGNGS